MSRSTLKHRSRAGSASSRVSRALALALGLSAAAPALAQEGACRQALVLALDVSGSVDSAEYRLQMDGLAQALLDPVVSRAILAPGAAPIALHIFEWSGPQFQNTLVDWTLVTDAPTLNAIAGTLRGTGRSPSPPSTALGTAIAVAATALKNGPACWKGTIDVSGDGKSNTGPRPQDLGDLAQLEGVTVNALVINTIDSMGAGPGDEDLMSYFENLVIRGPGAFVEPAEGFEDYTRAMTRKLLREIDALAVGGLAPDQVPDKG
ncbi:uncharacterized protein DUF1194 [Maritimibacter alkaliphilus HTCC2654]|uniref:DUF1194 domain-containing protein n=1 Tax=Maritimibacter alkaliphilus TaxID=404236 RepID=UPI00032314F1|nr:DUF1194 domain-containing protein [Maritimibacter alkaliphilus]TYP81761.1 uncharacterized protein DUF1194 [Maritimibacter alkaliphilus HTCC2654]